MGIPEISAAELMKASSLTRSSSAAHEFLQSRMTSWSVRCLKTVTLECIRSFTGTVWRDCALQAISRRRSASPRIGCRAQWLLLLQRSWRGLMCGAAPNGGSLNLVTICAIQCQSNHPKIRLIATLGVGTPVATLIRGIATPSVGRRDQEGPQINGNERKYPTADFPNSRSRTTHVFRDA